MCKLKALLLVLIVFGINQFAQSQEKYAVLITGDYAGKSNSSLDEWNNGQGKGTYGFDEFWNNTFLMWEMLQEKGYSPDNIVVLFAGGEDFSETNPNIADRYKPDPGETVTDYSASISNVNQVFNGLQNGTGGFPKVTEDDFLFVWTFDHGGWDGENATLGLIDGVMTDEEFAALVNPINANKKVYWMQQCHSGGFADDLEANDAFFHAACQDYESARRANDTPDIENEVINGITYHHGEFNFHVYSPTNQESPADDTEYNGEPYADADLNADNYITAYEGWIWESNHENTLETPVLSDQGSIGSYTSFEYPTLLHTDVTSNELYRGIIGVSKDVHITAGNQVTLANNADLTLLNDAHLIVDAGATLIIRDNVKLDGDLSNQIVVNGEIQVQADELALESGSALTFKGQGNMYFTQSNSKFIIKPGAHVVVDELTLTRSGNNTWQGIQVWGQADSSQFCISEPCPQGKLEIINGGTIENAEIGVDLWHPDHWNSMGGIVQAEDAVFRNNAKAVHASHYHNYNPYDPGTERDNLSYFTNCTFEITNDYPGTKTFYKHVDLADVRGIDFRGCDFSVNDQVNGVSTWNGGISAYDAGFGVYARCTNNTIPCNNYDSCTFTGFYKAVSATATSRSTYNFAVKRAQFTNNVHGVYGGAESNATILFNHFAIGPNNTGDSIQCINSAGTGVFIDNASGFAIEENSFEKAQGAPTDNYIGVRIKNTQATDEVYKNDFEGLSYGNFSEGQNWKDGDRFKGLAYYCNENTENYADFFVCDESPSGIQSKQGDTAYSAGNTFSPSADWHIYNGGDHLVAYYYCNTCPGETPEYYNNGGVVTIGQDTANPCPSHYGDGDEERQVTLTSDERLATEEDYYDNYTKYNNVESLYNNLKDGGSTQAELQTVENAQPDEMWEVRSQLLGDSPHLSMEVLKTTADKTEVFSDQAIFDIMAANPDELKKEELIKYLEEKEEPLPDYMISILEEVAEGTSYKTVLQRKMARYNRGKTRAAHDIIRSILSKDELDVQDLRNWLDNLGGLAADRQIISTYVQKGDFANAFTLAEMLPELYKLEGDALEEHGHYMNMLNLYQDLEQQGRNTFQLKDQERQEVEYIASASEGIAGSQAQNILEAVYGEHFYDCPDTEGEEGYKQSGIKPDDLNKL
ncbi:MAG: hypothetical protein K9I68_08025, partial [Bacteroidales bacterium]|nr:hypothetical protein [Bacteroidales bacterium]MCF8337054.1 hypothetical protein [Bacteroidales bacterium]